MELVIPANFVVACGLKQISEPTQVGGKTLLAKDYYELVDSPLLASPTIQSRSYKIDTTTFYVWMQGNIKPDWHRNLMDFEKFTAAQVSTMGDFPESEYHFLNLILSTPFYHGVEHRHSTMIVLGPDDEGEGLYTD